MPTLERDGSTVYYETHGQSGPPLLLCNGIGFASWSWWRQVPELSRSFQVIVFDNRGSGGSPWNGKAFTMRDLADDAASLLDRLNVEKAHVFGISMGGFVAQEFALSHPQRLLKLALGCTHCGAPEAVFMQPQVIERMTALAKLGWTDASVTASLDLNFSDDFLKSPENAAFVKEYVRKRVDNAPPGKDWVAQRDASLKFSTFARLGEIKAPTYVLHGDDDPVVPTQNAHILHQAIPGAQIRLWECARHGFFLERAPEVNNFIASHFRDV